MKTIKCGCIREDCERIIIISGDNISIGHDINFQSIKVTEENKYEIIKAIQGIVINRKICKLSTVKSETFVSEKSSTGSRVYPDINKPMPESSKMPLSDDISLYKEESLKNDSTHINEKIIDKDKDTKIGEITHIGIGGIKKYSRIVAYNTITKDEALKLISTISSGKEIKIEYELSGIVDLVLLFNIVDNEKSI